MTEVPDWSHRREHIEHRSRRKGEPDDDILIAWANEAFLDPQAAVIGWSDQAGFLITVITVRDPSRHLWGATAFRANATDERHYVTAEEER